MHRFAAVSDGDERLAAFLLVARAWFLDRSELTIENLAYRQQLASYKFQGKRPKIRPLDRILWVWLSRLWPAWRSTLVIVQPQTVIRWHRQGFRLYWSWKSRGQAGRPQVEGEVRDLIRRMSRENPTWGAPRIQSELALLGHDVCEATVAKYLVRSPKPPSQTWRTFLDNHVAEITAVDFFTVATATFRVLYVMIILCHHCRRVVHFNVTEQPTAEWAGQQMVEAFPYDQAPRFLLRDNDDTYGQEFRRRIASLDIEEMVTAKRSPLAKSLRRAADRLRAPRMPEPLHRAGPATSASHPGCLFRVLPWLTHPPVVGA